MTIIVFGDDHAFHTFRMCANVKLRALGPYTMRRLGQGGAFKTLEIGMPESGDTMIYMVGSEDIRRFLFRSTPMKGGDVKTTITALAQGYTEAVRWLTTLFDFPVRVCIVGVLPPVEPQWDDTASPPYGTLKARCDARKALNIALSDSCHALGVAFVGVPKLYETPDGTLNPCLSDGRGHIAEDHVYHLCEAVERIAGVRLGHKRPDRLTSLRKRYARIWSVRRGDLASLRQIGTSQQSLSRL
ncbi:hypothetical protein Q8W71_25515 [Methylobacterium sp. NEAU 140]|uniref:hypothetical protein n=1 Tax=Methylobacterium sp. NEAU 140 TaxID=3064945 RepID=UPI00273694ED|nr:hypothetical protein [Methylobacterium sp. NEAU 140]MDP4025996.1 hypothetical protein [Methylobacterium sp. NEAU 140]